MFKVPGESDPLDSLREQSVELILYARRLQQEFSELREASKLLRSESVRLREDVMVLRKSNLTSFTTGD